LARNGNGYFDPKAYTSILGSTFANKDHEALVVIGDRSWTRWQLGRIGCPHPSAAVRINRVIKTLRIKNTEEFIERASEFGRFTDIGVTCYATVLALVADCGADVEKVHGEDRSFNAIHSSALKALRPTKADKKTRGPSENATPGRARRRSFQ